MRTKFDRFAKDTWTALWEPAGRVETQVEVSADTHCVDFVVEPDEARVEVLRPFGLVARMAGDGQMLVEFFHDAPTVDGVLRCLGKHVDRRRQVAVPSRLWIVAAGRPSTALAKLGFIRDTAWPTGAYTLPEGFSTQLIVVSELPVRRDTLMLRVLGAGPVLRAALAEIASLPEDAPERSVVHPAMLRKLREATSDDPTEDEEFRMATDEFVQKWERELREEGRQEGRQEGSANTRREDLTLILRARFGELDAGALARIEAGSIEDLGRWIERGVTAERIADVFDPPQ